MRQVTRCYGALVVGRQCLFKDESGKQIIFSPPLPEYVPLKCETNITLHKRVMGGFSFCDYFFHAYVFHKSMKLREVCGGINCTQCLSLWHYDRYANEIRHCYPIICSTVSYACDGQRSAHSAQQYSSTVAVVRNSSDLEAPSMGRLRHDATRHGIQYRASERHDHVPMRP